MILILGNSIAVKNPEQENSYTTIGIGNLLVIEEKVYILTMEHLFSETAQDYLFLSSEENKPPIQFTYKKDLQNKTDACKIFIGTQSHEGISLDKKIQIISHKIHIHNPV